MRGITIIAIGGKHDSDLRSAIERYETRLRLYWWSTLATTAFDCPQILRLFDKRKVRQSAVNYSTMMSLYYSMNAAHSWAPKAFADKLSQWREFSPDG